MNLENTTSQTLIGTPSRAPAPQTSLPPARSHAGSPDIFDYDDYRRFLKDWFQWKKSVQPHYSGAMFAKRAGLNSHTILGMVIRKDRNLSHTSIRSFARALSLTGREALYFEKLVLFNQSDNSDDKAYYLEQLLSIGRGHGQKLLTRIRNHAQYLSHWYVVAIREMAIVKGFKEDPAWIAAKLKRRIAKKEAEEAWKIILELGLVALDPKTGGYVMAEPAIDLDPGVVDTAIRNYHKEYLKRAEDAIDNEPVQERELSSLTLAVSDEQLPRLRERIKEFRKQVNLEFSENAGSKDATKVVALNTQLLILTE